MQCLTLNPWTSGNLWLRSRLRYYRVQVGFLYPVLLCGVLLGSQVKTHESRCKEVDGRDSSWCCNTTDLKLSVLGPSELSLVLKLCIQDGLIGRGFCPLLILSSLSWQGFYWDREEHLAKGETVQKSVQKRCTVHWTKQVTRQCSSSGYRGERGSSLLPGG